MNTITAAAYEGDLVSRLRNWRGLHLAHGGRLYDEAADEIERLRQASTLSRKGETMGYMKELDIRIRQGGDDAIAAACELSGLAKERQGYEDIADAEGDLIDIVTVLRGVGFAAVSPEAGDSASLLHYCVTHAADEIERLRNERRWIPVAEQLPKDGEPVLWHYPEDTFCESVVGKRDGDSIDWGSDLNMDIARSVTHWMPLPERVRHHIPDAGKMVENTTNHDAVPGARARDADRGRTDKAVTRPGDGTGNTPSEAEIDALQFVVEEGRRNVDDYGVLRSWLIRLRPEWESDDKRVNTNRNLDTTQDECSVHGEGTQTVGERLVQRVLITQAMLNDNKMLRTEIARLRLSSAEREAVKWCRDNIIPMSSSASAFAFNHTATLRNLLERLT